MGAETESSLISPTEHLEGLPFSNCTHVLFRLEVFQRGSFGKSSILLSQGLPVAARRMFNEGTERAASPSWPHVLFRKTFTPSLINPIVF